jgi:CRP-like cAMP-binding protein
LAASLAATDGAMRHFMRREEMQMAAEKLAALELLYRRIEMRDELSPEEKAALLSAASEFKHFPVGSMIVQHGSCPEVCTLLVSGFASRFNFTEHGGRQITAIHVGGDFVDLHSLPLKRMDHGIGALSECAVLMFPHSNLIQVTQEHPHLTRLLWMLTLLDGAIHRRWLVAMGRTSAVSHMAHLLCELYLRLEAVALAHGHQMELPLTQHELSDTLGLSAVHTNRVLKELRNQGLVTWRGRHVTINDWHGLVELGQFDDEFLFREKLRR